MRKGNIVSIFKDNVTDKVINQVEGINHIFNEDDIITFEYAPAAKPLLQDFEIKTVKQALSISGDLYVTYICAQCSSPREQQYFM